MSRRALLIFQMENPRDDRVARWLEGQGYALDRRFPAKGEALPDPGEDYAVTVVYGGPQSANDTDERPYLQDEIDFIRDWCDRERPLLGLCLGAQLLSRAYGGKVAPHAEGLTEIGYVEVQPTEAGRAEFMPAPMHVYHWHVEGFEVPPEGTLLAEGQVFRNQAFRIGRHAYGLQFHPETTVPIFSSWMAEAGHMLALPGAQPRERQFELALMHDDPLAEWLESFLEQLLDGGAR